MPKFALGQGLSRLEDETLLRGAGRYTDDFPLAGAAHAVVVRSPHAHARIRNISIPSMPGVIAVLTGKDAAADGLGHVLCLIEMENLKKTPRPILALDTVRHVGDPVAVVIAETPAQAKDAADAVEVDYEPLPAVTDVREGEVAFDIGLGQSREKVEQALKLAAHVTRLELVNNRLVANPIEPRAALAEYDKGRVTLYTPSQGPHHLRGQIAGIVKSEEVRVVSGNVGGAFGMKIFLYPEQPMMVWAARRLKRSVRWTAERSESFLSDAQGRDNHSIAELAMDKDGRFLALRVTTWANMGAYLSNFGPFIPQLAAPMLSGVYRIPAIFLNIKGTLTHTVPVDAYRGAGRPEAIYLLERVVDAAARELGLAPDELRRRNFIAPSAMPYQTPVESKYDSGDFAGVMARAMDKAEWAAFPTRKKASRKLRGIGLAMYIERCGGGPGDTIRLKVEGDNVTAYSGMQDNGQGHTTTLVQLLSAKLGVDAAQIRVVQGDTDLVPTDGLTGGSRFLAIGGVAAQVAAGEVIDKGRQAAAQKLEAAASDIEYKDGEFRIAGTDRRVSLFQLGALEATHTRTPEEYTYPNGCHIAEVEIVPETGEAQVVSYVACDDAGNIVNHQIVEGQVQGGLAQGAGQVFTEAVVYDESGQLLTGSFMDYAMPRPGDVAGLKLLEHPVPTKLNPLGAKGVGEAGVTGSLPALMNAVVDALRTAGVEHFEMPATPRRLWEALQAAHRRAAKKAARSQAMDPRSGWRLAMRATRAWSADYASSMGAAISYYALFSIAPLLLIVLGVAGFVFGAEAARGELYAEISALVGADAARAVEGLVANARRPESGIIAMVTGTVLLVMGASTVFGELQNALDRIWRAPELARTKGWWKLIRTRALSFGMILGIAFLLMVSLVTSALVSALGKGWGLHVIDWLLSFALMTVLFAAIYKVIPRARVAWQDVWMGAAVTAALFAGGKFLIGLYIGRSSIASAFGAAGSLVVLMVWVYYSAQIFLLGAEFTRIYAEERGSIAGAPARRSAGIRVQPAANTPIGERTGRLAGMAKLGAALALGIGASISLNIWRRR